jgi:hypothetical protein
VGARGTQANNGECHFSTNPAFGTASRHSSDWRDHGRNQNRMIDYAGKIKAIDQRRGRRARRMGVGGYLFRGYDQQYGSAHGWSVLPIATIMVARTICHGFSCLAPERHDRQRLLDVLQSTTIRRAENSTTM